MPGIFQPITRISLVPEDHIKKLAGRHNLTADDMSKIIIQTGHASSIRGGELHGLEKGMFGGKYKQHQFAKHLLIELEENDHLNNVLNKIRMEKQRQSMRPEVKVKKKPVKEGTAAFDHDADYVDLTGGEGEPVMGGIDDDDAPVRPKKRKRPRFVDSDEDKPSTTSQERQTERS